MSFSDWLRKRWYVFLVFLMVAGLAAGVTSVVGDLYCYPLGRYSVFVGGMLGFGLTYLVYLMDRPTE